MTRRTVDIMLLSVIVGLSVAACSGAPSTTAPSAATSPPTAKASASAKAPAAQQATDSSGTWRFTVTGNHPVAANGSQDTQAQAGGKTCSSSQLAADSTLGGQIADGFSLKNFPVAAALLRHFLAGSGHSVNYAANSPIAKAAAASPQFVAARKEVTAAIAQQLAAGQSAVRLSTAQVPLLAAFSSTKTDLYWAFRGTQGLTVTGSGTRSGNRYVGTLTYVIHDSYGFPLKDTLSGFGPPMRYLQTVCGAPQHKGGARWFPASVVVTVPFSQLVNA